MDKNVTIITDPEGKKIVLINDIRFKGKRKEEWKEIEDYLKEYIGEYSEITETAEKIYIGTDFPDEFTHGKDKTILKGSNLKAKYGWYRYDTRLALPVYNDYGCFLQAFFGQSCKTFLDIVACPNWTKLQSVGQPY